MVLSKTTKDRNKTLMVLKFAYGMKNSQRSVKKQEGSCPENACKSQEKTDFSKRNSDRSLCNGKQTSSKDRKTDQKVQIIQHSNRTRRSITHASSEVDSAEDAFISLDDFRDRSGNCAKTIAVECNSVATGNVLHVSPYGFPDDAEESEKNGARSTLKNAIEKDAVLKFEGKARGDIKDNATEDIIKEIESASLVSLPQDKVNINRGSNFNYKSRDTSLKETVNIGSFTTQDIDSPPNAISPFLSRFSTESRISNATSESLLSNCSRSSQKSLAEKIIERRADLQQSTFEHDRFLDDHSVDISAASGSNCAEDSQFSIETKQSALDTSSENHTAKKTKHSPDLIPLEGENSHQIIRRRCVRKILTAE